LIVVPFVSRGALVIGGDDLYGIVYKRQVRSSLSGSELLPANGPVVAGYRKNDGDRLAANGGR